MAGWLFGRPRGGGAPSGPRVQRYLAVLAVEPDEGDVHWLASIATSGDEDRARWELRYARRALGLIVSERDALDDRTASLVAREMRQALQMDRNVAANMVRVAERQLNERLRAYRAALEARTLGESLERRLARILLGGAGSAPGEGDLERAAAIVERYLAEANDALRGSFGAAELPPNQRPSDWRSGQSR
ncbi:MAG TPA: hypothetical protein VF981_05715 [Gemmatimonadaceae bacterium]